MLNHLHAQPIRPKRVVVLGAKGFVGSHIVSELLDQEINVLALSRAEINLLDEHKTNPLQTILTKDDALVVVSAIAPCKTNAQLLDNLKMMKVVTDVLEKMTLSQVVYISSDAVYSEQANPVSEHSLRDPSSLHGMMHAAREQMLYASIGKTPLAILRPSLLYGANDPHNGYGPNRFGRLIRENKTITLFGNGEEKRDHVFIEDVARLVAQVLLHKSEGVLNIASGVSLSFREIAEYMVKQSGKVIAIEATPRQNPITHRHFDITACYKAFPGFHYVLFEEEEKVYG